LNNSDELMNATDKLLNGAVSF